MTAWRKHHARVLRLGAHGRAGMLHKIAHVSYVLSGQDDKNLHAQKSLPLLQTL